MGIKLSLLECCGQDEIRYICKTLGIIPNTKNMPNKWWPKEVSQIGQGEHRAPPTNARLQKGQTCSHCPEMLLDLMCFRNGRPDTESPNTGKLQQGLKGRHHVFLFTTVHSVPVRLLPVATVTNDHTLHGLKQHQCIILPF